MEDKEAGATGCQSQKEHHSVFEEGSAEHLLWGLCDGQEGLREGVLYPACGVGMSPACPRWYPQSFWKHWQRNQGEAGRGQRREVCVWRELQSNSQARRCPVQPRSGVGRDWLPLWVTRVQGLSREGRGSVVTGAEFNLIFKNKSDICTLIEKVQFILVTQTEGSCESSVRLKTKQ